MKCDQNHNNLLSCLQTNPLIYSLSLDDAELGETACRTRKQRSSPELYGATEVPSLKNTKLSSFTKRRCLPEDVGPVISKEWSTNVNEYVSCVSLTASNCTVDEKRISVLKRALQHSSRGTAGEHAQSRKNTNSVKYTADHTKSRSDKSAPLHRYLSMPGHHVQLDVISAEPSPMYSSTADSKHDLAHDLLEENPPTPTHNSTKRFKIPVEISRTLRERDESRSLSETEESTNDKPVPKCTTGDPDVATIGAQSSCKLVRRRENGGMLLVDVSTCSQRQSSREITSSDANNTSGMISNTDKETDDVQVITQNIKVGTLGYESESLTFRSNPETGVKCVSSSERKPEVNLSPQTPTKKEAAREEAHSTHEPKLDLHHESSDVILNSVRAPAGVNKRSPKKRKLVKTEMVQEPSEDVAARSAEIHQENQDGMSRSTADAFHTELSHTILKTPNESQKKDASVVERRKEALWDNWNSEETHSSELNGDAGFESSTVNNTELQSSITSAFDKKDNMSKNPLTDASVKISVQHSVILEQDASDENSLCGVSLETSPVRKVDRFTQYCAEDHVTTLDINKGMCSVADQVKSTKRAKKYISCKYCRRSFRHLSAYSVHQRIHTGEKPYRCELCGKNFTQLSKLKSHRKAHVQSVSLQCPCCRRTFSEKRDLMAHFTSHIKNLPGKQDRKPDAPSRNPTHGKSGVFNRQDMHKPEQDKRVSCRTCGKAFQTSLQLVDHEKTHWPVKPYACSVCAKGFTRIKALKRHSRKHTGDTPFSCSRCDSAFCDLPGLRTHQISKVCNRRLNRERRDLEDFLVTHAVDGQVNTPVSFKCHICKQLYQKWCQYTLHLQTHTDAPLYLCFACGQSYNKDSEVSAHCRICCRTSGEEAACGSSLPEIFRPRKDSCLTDSSPAVETSKGKSWSSPGQFHENISNQQTEHLMPESSQTVKSSQAVDVSDDGRLPPSPATTLTTCVSVNETLERVEQSRSLWRFECPRCGQRYKRYRSLCFHMRTHAPTFRYVCGRCGCSFERWNKLYLHQRIHRRRYACSQCNLQFDHYSSYKVHLLNHAEERPYASPLYPQAKGLQCDIQQPARPFQCDVCARSFSNLTRLVKHGLLHSGAINQQCLLCSCSFANNRSLQQHINVHHNPASLLPSIPSEPLRFPHKCNRCKSSFSTGDLLYAHQICHTRDLKRHVPPTQSSASTSVSLEGTRQVSSTSRRLLSSLDLDAIPNESLYTYPHPDKLYVPSRVSSTSKRLQIINLDPSDEALQEVSTNPVCPDSGTGSSRQKLPESSQTDMTHQPQALGSQESVQSQIQATADTFQNKTSHSCPTQMPEYVETSVFLEGPSTTVTPAETGTQDEIFECADCSEHVGSLLGLYEHYFLHALGNTPVQVSLKEPGRSRKTSFDIFLL